MVRAAEDSNLDSASSPLDSDDPAPVNRKTSNLAQRISGLTSNLIATAIILILALAGGREVISWWRAEPEKVTTAPEVSPSESWIIPNDSHALEFGDLPLTLRRDRIQGDRSVALEELRETCKRILKSGAIAMGEIGPAERRLIENSRNRDPIEQEPGKWRLFQAKEPIPMVVGIRDDCPPNAPSGNVQSRMVAWGMTVPSSESESSEPVWTNYSCRFINRQPSTGQRINVPLPPGGTKTLSIEDVDGASVTGFKGQSPIETMEFFSDWAKQNGIEETKSWQAFRGAWRAEFAHKKPSQVKIEIQLAIDGDRSVAGLITTSAVNSTK